jgi:hypothetical protein
VGGDHLLAALLSSTQCSAVSFVNKKVSDDLQRLLPTVTPTPAKTALTDHAGFT